jgi:hypothetical protein
MQIDAELMHTKLEITNSEPYPDTITCNRTDEETLPHYFMSRGDLQTKHAASEGL